MKNAFIVFRTIDLLTQKLTFSTAEFFEINLKEDIFG